MSTLSTVPDFFQEETGEALRSQADWLAGEFGVDDTFFANLVGTEALKILNWRTGTADLPPGAEETLRRFWRLALHLLSFLNFDSKKIKDLFEGVVPDRPAGEWSALTPPWGGSSLKGYLERARDAGIEKVEAWVTGLRFGDPYAA